MAIKTYAEQLESVQQTIERIETTGQAYGISGRSLTRADLNTLYEREKYLRRQVNRAARGGVRTRGIVPRG